MLSITALLELFPIYAFERMKYAIVKAINHKEIIITGLIILSLARKVIWQQWCLLHG